MWNNNGYNAETKRSKNFSDREISLLLDILTGYVSVIENKRTDNMSCRVKNAAWENITIDYNNSIEQAPIRTVRQLKNCYENFKKKTRREFADLKINKQNNHLKKKLISQNGQRLLKLLSVYHKNQPTNSDGECSNTNMMHEETLFMVEDDSASYEPEMSIKYEQSDEEEGEYDEITPDYKISLSEIQNHLSHQIIGHSSNHEINSRRKFDEYNCGRKISNHIPKATDYLKAIKGSDFRNVSENVGNNYVEVSNEKNNSLMSWDNKLLALNVHNNYSAEASEEEMNHMKRCQKIITASQKLIPDSLADVNKSPIINIKSAADINSSILQKSGDLTKQIKDDSTNETTLINKESIKNNNSANRISKIREENADNYNNNTFSNFSDKIIQEKTSPDISTENVTNKSLKILSNNEDIVENKKSSNSCNEMIEENVDIYKNKQLPKLSNKLPEESGNNSSMASNEITKENCNNYNKTNSSNISNKIEKNGSNYINIKYSKISNETEENTNNYYNNKSLDRNSCVLETVNNSSSLANDDEEDENERSSTNNKYPRENLHNYSKNSTNMNQFMEHNFRTFNKSQTPMNNLLKRKHIYRQKSSSMELTENDRIKMTDFYENMNEVITSKKMKTMEEEAFVKRRQEIMLEIEEINLRNALMQSKILENNLRASELEVRLKEKALNA